MSLGAEGTAITGGVRFLGARKAYWRLMSRGAVLLAVTLGIYRFWLNTDVRRFLWGNTEIAGDSLEYNGTPVELLTGFLAAIAILIPVYAGFFFAALDIGPIGETSGVVGFALLAMAGQYASYRARRYRLTRTVFRGLRFHQEGSALVYALRAVAWWIVTALTIGLAYPFQLASLERYKMRHTYYGDLGGRFAGAGWKLFLRGVWLWLIIVAPLALTVGAFLETVDWDALDKALSAADASMTSIDAANPGLAAIIVFAVLMAIASVVLALLLYPAYQAIVLRWWTAGLRFGDIEMRSHLPMWRVYVAYLRFVGLAFLFSLALGIASLPAVMVVGLLTGGADTSNAGEIAGALLLLGGYVTVALGFSTLYRVTVLLSLWQLAVESLHLSGLAALDNVHAKGAASSPLGEGLAEALHVSGT